MSSDNVFIIDKVKDFMKSIFINYSILHPKSFTTLNTSETCIQSSMDCLKAALGR